jgi:glycine cleavage system transcriptional repressor
VTAEQVQDALIALPALARGEVTVRSLSLSVDRGPKGTVTHRVTVRGQDRPGLVARLAEGFAEHGANIVNMDAHRIPGERAEYVIRFEVFIPEDRQQSCLANAANTAEMMSLAFSSEDV